MIQVNVTTTKPIVVSGHQPWPWTKPDFLKPPAFTTRVDPSALIRKEVAPRISDFQSIVITPND